MTKSDLRTQVSSWLNRTDLTDAQIDLFITATEADIRNDVTVRDSEAVATGTVSSGSFSAPTGFLYARHLEIDGSVVEYVSPDRFAQLQDSEYTSGYYTIRGSTFLVLGGTDYSLTYFGTISALSADASENWVLTNAPDVYLWGACKYGSVFLRDPEAAQGYGELYRSAVLRLNALEVKARYGGPMMVRVG